MMNWFTKVEKLIRMYDFFLSLRYERIGYNFNVMFSF